MNVHKLCLMSTNKKIRLNYSVTIEYIAMLGKVGLITKRRNEDRTVSVKSLVRLNNNGEIKTI